MSDPLPSPAFIANAAAQRVPLPDISGSLPSELNNWLRSNPSSRQTNIHPSAPIPVLRWQIRRAISASPSRGASLAQVNKKSFSTPCSLVNAIRFIGLLATLSYKLISPVHLQLLSLAPRHTPI